MSTGAQSYAVVPTISFDTDAPSLSVAVTVNTVVNGLSGGDASSHRSSASLIVKNARF